VAFSLAPELAFFLAPEPVRLALRALMRLFFAGCSSPLRWHRAVLRSTSPLLPLCIHSPEQRVPVWRGAAEDVWPCPGSYFVARTAVARLLPTATMPTTRSTARTPSACGFGSVSANGSGMPRSGRRTPRSGRVGTRAARPPTPAAGQRRRPVGTRRRRSSGRSRLRMCWRGFCRNWRIRAIRCFCARQWMRMRRGAGVWRFRRGPARIRPEHFSSALLDTRSRQKRDCYSTFALPSSSCSPGCCGLLLDTHCQSPRSPPA